MSAAVSERASTTGRPCWMIYGRSTVGENADGFTGRPPAQFSYGKARAVIGWRLRARCGIHSACAHRMSLNLRATGTVNCVSSPSPACWACTAGAHAGRRGSKMNEERGPKDDGGSVRRHRANRRPPLPGGSGLSEVCLAPGVALLLQGPQGTYPAMPTKGRQRSAF